MSKPNPLNALGHLLTSISGEDRTRKLKSLRTRSALGGSEDGETVAMIRPANKFDALRKRHTELGAGPFAKAIPSVKLMKEHPDLLKAAISRGQVKQIAKVANPKSPDTRSVFTAGGRRYAKTDVYSPTGVERIAYAKHRVKESASSWWDQNKTTVVVAGIASIALLLWYNTWRATVAQRHLSPMRAAHPLAHRAGYGGWYERDFDQEAANAQAQIAHMYPDPSTFTGWW